MPKTKPKQRGSVDDWLDSLDPATTPARDARHLRAIGRALDQLEKDDRQLVQAIADARAAGDSWAAIAAVLGTSRQAAHRKFAPLLNESTGT